MMYKKNIKSETKWFFSQGNCVILAFLKDRSDNNGRAIFLCKTQIEYNLILITMMMKGTQVGIDWLVVMSDRRNCTVIKNMFFKYFVTKTRNPYDEECCFRKFNSLSSFVKMCKLYFLFIVPNKWTINALPYK
jgi:hypothetical protein